MKNRQYHYIYDSVSSHDIKDDKHHEFKLDFKYKTIDIESDDLFEGELEIIAFHISLLPQVDKILELFNLRKDVYYFYKQCQEVISVPEQHVNDKGKGKITFQIYFHNIPYSVASINDNATVVVALEPLPQTDENKPRNYNLVGYIHANEFDFNPLDKEPGLLKGYFYNMLRISELCNDDGSPRYRKRKVFTLLFSVFRSLADNNKFHFSYATMGRENQTITQALRSSSERHGKTFEMIPFTVFTKINMLYGKKRYANQLIDITENRERLQEMYDNIRAQKGHFLFFYLHSFEVFETILHNLKRYSKASRVYMIADEHGNMKAATVAMNWGDYFAMTLKNPKGIFKFIAALKLTDRFLYPFLTVGEVDKVRVLYKGLAYKYLKEHRCYMTLLNSEEGDPYRSVKKSIIYDDYRFCMICSNPDDFERFKKIATDENGHMHLFYDNPLL